MGLPESSCRAAHTCHVAGLKIISLIGQPTGSHHSPGNLSCHFQFNFHNPFRSRFKVTIG